MHTNFYWVVGRVLDGRRWFGEPARDRGPDPLKSIFVWVGGVGVVSLGSLFSLHMHYDPLGRGAVVVGDNHVFDSLGTYMLKTWYMWLDVKGMVVIQGNIDYNDGGPHVIGRLLHGSEYSGVAAAYRLKSF